MQLRLSNDAISGILAGKPIRCEVRIAPGTGSLPAGAYKIFPPTRDPMYGLTALALPLDQGSTGSGGYAREIKYALASKMDAPRSAQLKAAALASKVATPMSAQLKAAARAQSSKVDAPRSALTAAAGGGAAEVKYGTKEVLVLSDKPIAGRNCLVVSQGFADLMLGLVASDGATLTVL